MRILVTGSRTRLGAALVHALSPDHDVRTLDIVDDGRHRVPTYVGDPLDHVLSGSAVAGCDAVIHQAPLARPGARPVDVIESATRGTWELATQAQPGCRFILISSLRTFERYPMDHFVTELWAPRPTTEIDDLAPYLAELVARECARASGIHGIVLRMGEVVDGESIQGRPANPNWLHVEDAVEAVRRALVYDTYTEDMTPWHPSTYHVYHIVGAGKKTRFPLGLAGQKPFGYVPRHDLAASVSLPLSPAPPREVKKLTGKVSGAGRRVVIFGAGGGLGVATTEALRHDHILRVTDIRPLSDIMADKMRLNPTAPPVRLLEPPHEMLVADNADPDQVRAVVRGMDGMLNPSVLRNNPVLGFRANFLGVYNMLVAAVECDIRRFVHTALQGIMGPGHPYGYGDYFEIDDDTPIHSCSGVYGLTKYLSEELCRIFAEEHDLEVAVLRWLGFVNPDVQPTDPLGGPTVCASWADAAEAMRAALHQPTFRHPFEAFYPVADLPARKKPNDKIKRLLGWQPRDQYPSHWQRSPE